MALPLAIGASASTPVPLSRGARDALEELLERTRAEGERLIAKWRLVLAGFSIARSAWVWQAVGWGAAAPPLKLASGLLLVTAVFSVAVLWRVRARAPYSLLLASTLLDVGICTLALLTNVFWPEPGYRGMIFMPEMCAVVVPILVSALRLSAPLTLLSSLLSFGALFAIVGLDVGAGHSGGTFGFAHLSAFVAFLVGAATIAAIAVARTLSLVRVGAERGLAAERAGRNLGFVLDHHRGARATLRSATARSREILRSVSEEGGSGETAVIAAELVRDLEAVQGFLVGVDEQSYGDLLALQSPRLVDASDALQVVLPELASRFPGVRISVDELVPRVRVRVAGGVEGLGHLLHNVLVNACEGDGVSHARNVIIALTHQAGAEVTLEVADDGPGFPPAFTSTSSSVFPSTKASGSGIGLSLVRRLLEASGGALSLRNGPEHGAIVRLTLPAV